MQENFKTAAFGFNKKDVIDYIFDLTTQKEQNEKSAAEQIAELTAERDRLLAENEVLSKTKSELEEKNQQLKAEVADADIHRSRLFEEINESRRMLLDNEREFNIKNEQIAKLISENEAYAAECEKYAEISRDVGKTIMEAKNMATEIVEKAKKEAEEVRKASEKNAQETLREVASAQNEVDTLKRNLSDVVRVCENRIKTVELNLKSVIDAVSPMANGEPAVITSECAPIEELKAEENHEFF